jgi:hypothetical protein
MLGEVLDRQRDAGVVRRDVDEPRGRRRADDHAAKVSAGGRNRALGKLDLEITRNLAPVAVMAATAGSP